MLSRASRLALLVVLMFALGTAAGCGSDVGQRPPTVADRAEALASRAMPSTDKVPFRFFSPSSFWNEPLPADAALDPSSAASVAVLAEEVAAEAQTESGPSIATIDYSVPVYTVPVDQPVVRVQLVGHSTHRSLQAAWNAVPLPPDAHPAAGTDKHLVVWQPSTDKLWEFWQLEETAEGWQAEWGGAMEQVSSECLAGCRKFVGGLRVLVVARGWADHA